MKLWRASVSEAVLLGVLVLTFLVMSRLSPHFLTPQNLLELPRFFAEVGLIALAMTLVILTGGIDLSVGSIVGLSAVVLGVLHQGGIALPLAALAALLVGLGAGLVNGFLVTRVGIPPLITTLATMAVFRGIALGISQGRAFRDYPDYFFFLGQGYVGPFPVQLFLFGALALAFAILLSRTAFGRKVYAIGHNEVAMRFMGHDVDRVKLAVYTLSGTLSGLAALVLVSRFSTAKADLGQGFELDAITAVVLGGTSISGGVGGIWGTVLGLLVVGAVRNGMTLAFINADVQQMIIGGVLVASVALYGLMDKLAPMARRGREVGREAS